MMKERDGSAPTCEAQEQMNLIVQMKYYVVVGSEVVMIPVSLREHITKHMATLAQ